MIGTYQIKKVLTDSAKFCCMVSFNGGTAELYEVELPNDIGDGAGKNLPQLNAEYVDSVLQKVADESLAASESKAQTTEDITVSKGKIVI